MYGAQTHAEVTLLSALFENDVEMYGAQTASGSLRSILRLRMM